MGTTAKRTHYVVIFRRDLTSWKSLKLLIFMISMVTSDNVLYFCFCEGTVPSNEESKPALVTALSPKAKRKL